MSEFNVSRRDLFRLTAAGFATTTAAPWFGNLAVHAASVPTTSRL